VSAGEVCPTSIMGTPNHRFRCGKAEVTNTLEVRVSSIDHLSGRAGAPLQLVEYGDFQCPYCGEAYWDVKEIQEDFGDELAFVFREFPLTQAHGYALGAAAAAEAADQQGRFWAMHDRLFEHQQQLRPEDLRDHADALGLDLARFATDYASDAVARRIEADLRSGVASGVPGTPAFFINGVLHEDNFDRATLTAALRTREDSDG
jgi:NhaA family Na+:H+ antiporter